MRRDRPFDDTVWRRAARIAREYRLIVERENGEFLVRAVELPTVFIHGSTVARAEKKAREALTVAVATMIESGQIPPSAGKRTAQVNIRLTAEEKLLLEECARRDGFRGVSDYLRHVALAQSRRSA